MVNNIVDDSDAEPTENEFLVGDDHMTEFRQPIQVQSHQEMPEILVQLGRIQRT